MSIRITLNKTIFYVLSGFWALLLFIMLFAKAIPLLPGSVKGMYDLPPAIEKVFAVIMTVLLTALFTLHVHAMARNKRRLMLYLFIIAFFLIGLEPYFASKFIVR